MRILFTAMPATGHLRPLLPIGQTARHLGHDVVVCTPGTAASAVAAYGLPYLPAGHDWVADELREVKDLPDVPADEAAGLELYLTTEGYPGPNALKFARDVIAHAGTWAPDVIVRENAEFGGYLAAEALGVPHASVGVAGAAAEYLSLDRVAPALAARRTELGLPADPDGKRVHAYLHANLTPVEFDPKELSIPNTRCYRQLNPVSPADRLPGWVAGLPADRPLVFAAFGSMQPMQAAVDPTVRAVIEGLGGIDCTAIVAVGEGKADGHYPVVPANVRLVETIAQPLLLESADLFIHHGGAGSMREGLRCGVPMLVLPWVNDQIRNAGRAEQAGVAVALGRDGLAPGDVSRACERMLADRAYAARARDLQRQVLALPPIDAFIDDLGTL